MRLPFCFAMLLLLAPGCATTEETADTAPDTTPAAAGFGRANLAPTDPRVRTVQLYRTGDEGSLPVIPLRSSATLTLSFDVMDETSGGPLSVYFYHADRTWRRDLIPSEYLSGFVSDDVRDYQPSLGTMVRYVHYEYEFPNSGVSFLLSGNYVLRVTEQGDERAVLFERAFFVSEDAAEVDFALRGAFGSTGTLLLPVVRLRPSGTLADAQPFDYHVCFVRNGRAERGRCTSEPTLLERLFFEFSLPREAAYAPEGPLHEVDLGLLQVSPEVINVDYSTNPWTAVLDLDYARFGGLLRGETLAGQPLVNSVAQGVGDAGVEGEYVNAVFRYVPEGERAASGSVFVTGAFNDWQIDPAYQLTWNAAERRYEGSALLKQGLYLYGYHVDDAAARDPIDANQPALYTALVYLFDPRRLTDRLVAWRSAVSP